MWACHNRTCPSISDLWYQKQTSGGSFKKIFSSGLSTQLVRLWPCAILTHWQRNDVSAAGWASADISVIEQFEDSGRIEILKPGNISHTAKQVTAPCNLPAFIPGRKQTVMPIPVFRQSIVVLTPQDIFHEKPWKWLWQGEKIFPVSLPVILGVKPAA